MSEKNSMTVKVKTSQIKSYMDILDDVSNGRQPRKIYVILDNRYKNVASHYSYFGEEGGKTISVDISKTYYEWDEMYENYVSNNGKNMSSLYTMAFLSNVAFYVPPAQLDYYEEEYLCALLEPYVRNNKVMIAKENFGNDFYKIHCIFENCDTKNVAHTVLPEFPKTSSMYESMEPDRTYLLYELGLTDF